ncbi:MAG TPA: hypothetical protein VF870_12315, partial [Ignavibacteriaceae bacterium]
KKNVKVEETKVDAIAEISTLIQTLTVIASLKFGEHWTIDEAESNSIATPLNSILNKFNLVDKIAGVSDGVALVVATVSIAIPRIIIQSQLNSQKSNKQMKVIKANGGMKDDTENSSTTISNTENNVGGDTSSITSDGQFIKAISG